MLAFTPALLFGNEKENALQTESGYTINYNTIGIVEYIKFASKICNVNFIFNEEELQFTVTVVSDAPITQQNVMATLLQTLRIHGMELLEQGNSLVIHKSPNVRQIASLVFDPTSANLSAPIVTRVFRLKFANPGSVAAILKPMLSDAALVEVSQETKQLILTDITVSVEKAAALIENLDAPHSPLEIRTYAVKYNKPDYLINLVHQIMAPMAQGTPFILVPHPLANSIFIVSTPELDEKAAKVLESLDTPPTGMGGASEPKEGCTFFLYKAVNKSPEELEQSVHEMADNLSKTEGADQELISGLRSVTVNPSTKSLMFSGNPASFPQVKEILAHADTALPEEMPLFFYKPTHKSSEELEKSLNTMADNLAKSGLADESVISTLRSVKINPTTGALTFSGNPGTFPRIKEMLANTDTKATDKSSVFTYKAKVKPVEELEQSIHEAANNLAKSGVTDESLLSALRSAKVNPKSNTLTFSGKSTSFPFIKEILANSDATLGGGRTFFFYKALNKSPEELEKSIHEMANNLAKSGGGDEALISGLRSVKVNPSTHALMFSGNPSTFPQIKEMLAHADAGPNKGGAALTTPDFSVYRIQSSDPGDLQEALKVFASNLTKAKVDPDLVHTLEGMKYIKQTHSLLFTGPASALKKAHDLAQMFDTGTESVVSSSQFLVYKPKFQSGEEILRSVKDLKDHLNAADLKDPALMRTLDSMKWVKITHSILITGDPASLKRAEQLLSTIDVPAGEKKSGYTIYKVQNTTGDLIEEDLENLIKNMHSAGMKGTPLLQVLEHVRYVKETNSLLLTGDPAALAEAEALIARYDHPRQPTVGGPGNFFLYKPQNQPAHTIEKSLKDIASNLHQSSLADPGLLSAIASMKYVESTNSLIFTGSPDSIQKIQVLLKDIDVPPQKHAPIQHIGKTTFLLYKLKHASATQITASLRAITTDLKKSGAADKEFITALNSMKYVKETNSLMFTGTEESLQKVESLVDKFDVAGQALPTASRTTPATLSGPSNFIIYKPQALSPEELSRSLNDFAENLKMSGLNDPELFQSIESIRIVPNSLSLVVTGDPKTLERVKALLHEFDIARGQPSSDLQSIDNTSFLVYKLQFHKGDEIQGALRQIGKDLVTSNATVNQNLLNAIQSVQWLEVTNSLLCSGEPETLTRLRELIKNLDVPLKQVFIEMLVLQTSLTNAIDFGLEWGGKAKIKDKLAVSFNNLLPTDTVSNGSFSSNLQNIFPPGTTPVPTDVPFSSGFDLGVIGDIIMHKGESFLSLGSLLNAIQTDAETTVVLTPKIITQDSKTSTIFVGQNVPFAGSFISNQSSNTVSTSNLEYRNIGFNMSITPVLGNSSIITLELNIDSSNESGSSSGATFTFSAGQATGITTNQANLQTTVHVPDRHFLILSGMVNNSHAKQTASIPCLGGIPLIGAAFTQNYNTDALNSLVIFIRPTILHSIEEMKQLTADQESFFREQTATPFLQHNFDEGMENIKSPDDE